jgi:cytochrome b561
MDKWMAVPKLDENGWRDAMQLWNTKESYGWVAIALHWLIALGVVMIAFIGLRADQVGETDRALRGELMGYHVAWGATLLVLVILRIISHYAQPQPVKPPQAGWLNMLATVTQNLLIIAVLVQFLSGPLAVWSAGRPINVWDVFKIPTPFAERNESVHAFAGVLHFIGRWTIFVVLPLHILGALKHLVIDRDGTFRRILWPSKLKAKA